MSSGAAKRTRVRTPAVKRDPVIAALIAKLPAENAPFTRAQRVNWLRLMSMAMDGAFGVEPAIGIEQVYRPTIEQHQATSEAQRQMAYDQMRAPPAPIVAPPGSVETRYYIGKDGMARMEPGNVRVNPFDIPDGSDLEDERDGDDALDTIKWKSGQFPPAAYPERSFNIMKVR